MTELRCSLCKEMKPTTAYDIARKESRGYQYICKVCNSARNRRAWWSEDRLDSRKRSNKAYRLMKLYGLTVQQYNDMRENQDYCCATCGLDEDELGYELHVDHNHETGFNRGMLCAPCNKGLGHFKSDPVVLRKAAEYAENNGWGGS